MIIITTGYAVNFSFIGLNWNWIKSLLTFITLEASLMPRLFSSSSVHILVQVNCFIASSTNFVFIPKVFKLIWCLIWPARWAWSKLCWRRIPWSSQVWNMFLWTVISFWTSCFAIVIKSIVILDPVCFYRGFRRLSDKTRQVQRPGSSHCIPISFWAK